MPVQRVCEACGKEFSRPPSRSGRFCSQKCYKPQGRPRLPRKQRTCERCRIAFEAKTECRASRYCSRSCSQPGFREPALSRLLAKIEERADNECHPWLGQLDEDGYGKIKFGGKSHRAVRLLWETVYGPIPVGLVVRHVVCDNPICCNRKHLKLGTPDDNKNDSVRQGRHAHGERNGGAKLTEVNVRYIRFLWETRAVKQPDIARAYDVSLPTINRICRGAYWKNV